jgi:Amt family ammonium transporter
VTSIVLGAVASLVCFFFVTKVKNALGYDDSLDVFGVHCIGGIVGALGTGIVAAPSLGGQGVYDYTVAPAKFDPSTYNIAHQLWVQVQAVGITLLWSGLVSLILFFVIDKTIGLRPTAEAEREGLDINEHGERAYNL